MVGMDSSLATSLARRLDTLLAALNAAATTGRAAPPGAETTAAATAVDEAASAQVELAPRTQTSAGAADATGNAGLAPPRDGAQTGATLSAAARTIDLLLQLAPDPPGPVRGTTPLWPVPPGDAGRAFAPAFATALKAALDGSGLFYESHLAQWAAGSRSLAQLRQDPQAHWPSGTDALAASAVGNMRVSSVPQSEQATNPNLAGTPMPASVADPATLLRQQLDMLVAPQFHWSGQAWPGATLDWHVAPASDDDRADPAPPSTDTWRTRLRLSLAALGHVDIDLSLVGHQVHVHVDAEQPHTLSLLDARRDDLRQRLAAAGLMAAPVRIGPLPGESDESGEGDTNAAPASPP